MWVDVKEKQIPAFLFNYYNVIILITENILYKRGHKSNYKCNTYYCDNWNLFSMSCLSLIQSSNDFDTYLTPSKDINTPA